MKKIKHIIYITILGICFPWIMSAQVPFPDLVIQGVTHNNQNVNYQNSHGITSPASPAQPVLITGTSQVEYKAGTRISLLPGFKSSGLTGTGRYHALIAPPDFEVAIIEPTSTPGTVGKFEKFEMGLKLPANVNQLVDDYLVNNNPAGINPYDPEEISVVATFTSPTGTQNRTIYGFYMKDYVRNYTTQTWDINNATINYPWRIRFAPTELNTINNSWTCNITISSPYFTALTVNNLKFNCVTSSNKGYLQVGLHKRQFRFSGTGESFFAIGQNIPWAEPGQFGQQPFVEYANFTDSWETSLASSGGNFMRFLLAVWSHEFEWEKLGDYHERQKNAWEVDKIIKTAEQNGIYIMMNILMHNQFELSGSEGWAGNPYNSNSSHNGGTYSGVNTPYDFLTSTTARNYFKKRLRYIVSRWGYSTNVAAYELLSEVDNWDGYVDNDLQKIHTYTWVYDMKNYIKTTLGDVNHMVSTSYANNPIYYWGAGDWSYDYMDFTSRHKYGNDRKISFQRYDNAKGNTKTWDKPFIIGELGFIKDTADAYDIEGCNDVSFHNSLWSTALMNSFGTGLNWWQHRNNTYRQNNFPALKSFFNGIDFETNKFTYAQDWKQGGIFSGNNYKFEVFALRNFNQEKAIAWAHNATNYWYNIDPNCTDHQGVKMNKPSDDDNYTAPTVFNTTPPQNIEVHGLKIGKLRKRNKYYVYTYNTRGSGGQVTSDLIKINIFGTLKIPFSISAYDWAYKIVKQGSIFRILEDENDIDSLSCPIDTIYAEGSYDNDLNGLFGYSWNFGNGQTSTQVHPKIYYSTPGTYTVTLIVIDTMGIKDTLSQRIYVPNCNLLIGNDPNNPEINKISLGKKYNIDENNNPPDFAVYPNPNNGKFELIFSKMGKTHVKIIVYDVLGNVFLNKISDSSGKEEIDMGMITPGIYFVKIIYGNTSIIKKISVE